MSELNPAFERLARGMLQHNIVKFGAFTLKDLSKSAAYVNLRDMISLPLLFAQATDAYAATLRSSGLHRGANGALRHLAPIPEAATLYGGAVAHELGMPLVYRRVKSKEYGQPRAVEGIFGAGDEAVLLDDVVKSSQSKREEAEALAKAGLSAAGVVVLVDREQGGRTELESSGFQFAAAMTLSGIAKYALDERLGGVTQTLYDQLLGELNPQEVNA